MKNYMLLFLAFSLISPSYSGAKDFLGAPVFTQGNITLETDSRLELATALSHDEVVSFYKEALKKYRDIKYRDWKNATYIEDDGNLAWHSITISKGAERATTVIIVKDNWTWIIGTLVLRYVGVFVVLLVLFLGMSISGSIISRTIRKAEGKKGAD
jgi:hypothetical protein